MMPQIGQVMATYWRRAISDPASILMVGILALGVVAVVFVAVSRLVDPVPATRPTEAMLMELTIQLSLIACAALIGPFLIALHFKQQIIQIRQRRIPNAVAAHVIVAIGFLVLSAVGLPAAIMALDTWSWGTLGLVFAITAATFAYYTLLIVRLLILVPAFIFICCFPSMRHWLEDLLHGRHAAFGLLLLAVGICGIAATLKRLLHITEEDRGFLDLSDLRIYSQCQRSTAGEPPQTSWILRAVLWISRLGPPSERQVQLWPQWARGSRWQRSKLWSVVWLASSVWPFDIFFIGLFSAEYIWWPSQRSTLMMSGAFFMMVYPVFCVMGTLWQHKFLDIESLWPAGRSQFLMELGLLYAKRVAVAWLVLNISWCLPAFVFVSDAPHWGHQMFNLLVLSAAVQVFLFGLAAWLMQSVGTFNTWFTLLVLNFPAMFLPQWISCDWRNASLGALHWLAAAILVAGILMTWEAHRRWMQTELGAMQNAGRFPTGTDFRSLYGVWRSSR